MGTDPSERDSIAANGKAPRPDDAGEALLRRDGVSSSDAQSAVVSLEAEVEYAIRLVEARVEHKLVSAQREVEQLRAQIQAERGLALEQAAEIEVLSTTTKRLRADLAVAKAKLSKFDWRLDAAEDEFEVTLQSVEREISGKLQEADARHAGEVSRLQALAAERENGLRERIATLEAELASMRSSLSWRMTSPLRVVGRGRRTAV